MSNAFIYLSELVREYSLEGLYLPEGYEKIKVTSTDVNRPGLQLAGFMDHFDHTRVQIIGKVESTFLGQSNKAEKIESFERIFSSGIPCVIVTRGLEAPKEMLEVAAKYKVPVFRTYIQTSRFMSALIAHLSLKLAPSIRKHGVLVEVYGEGILLLGKSGVGKSETAIELVKRGHRLIADDAVDIKRVSEKTLVGEPPELIRHFIELRGIGVVDVRNIFGMGAIKATEKIDLVVQLEQWDDSVFYERLGMDEELTNILGIEVPILKIPVKPGRNLAIILEVAAMNNRQKKMGYNAAEALNTRLVEFEKQGEEK